MKKVKFVAPVLTLLLALLPCAPKLANADTTSSNQTTASTATSTYDKIAQKAALTYFGIYRGASMNDLSNPLQPGVDGAPDATAPQSLESYVTAGYKLDPNTIVGVVTHFNYFMVGNPAGTGQDMQMLDPALLFSRAKWVDNGNGLTIKGLVTLNLPWTRNDFLQKHGLATSISPTAALSWDVPKTKLNLGVYSYVTAYIPGSNADVDARTYKIYVAPNAAYKLTDTVSATMWVDLIQTTRAAGTGFFSGMQNATMDIEPGIAWDIMPNLTFNPVLNIYPGNMTLASTSLQAVIIGKVF